MHSLIFRKIGTKIGEHYISLFHKEEPFHKNSVNLMTEIWARKNEARVIIPSIVFFETIFKLVQIGIPQQEIEAKLWKFLYLDQIFNVGIVETSGFRLLKRFPRTHLKGFKTSDFLIVSTALAFDAVLLTYDQRLRRNAGQVYPKIYYCDSQNKEFGQDSDKFLRELKNC
ncbi:PIN domain-containing protein [Candidatus Peregrinibacteria bacterium]|nr:PIN domain-containing protein [Candidatus Peregrinibacteria bacterium]